MADQTNWRWCHKCEGLFRDIGNWGACPAGGFHEAVSSGNYIIELNPQVNAQEAGWLECRYCRSLFRTIAPVSLGSGTIGAMEGTIRRCPALGTGSGHHRGEGNPTAYLRTGDAGESFQPGWRQCGKCECLFFAGSSRPLGKCPVDGAPHSPTDTPYSVGTYRLARLPVPAKAAVGKRVALRIADKGILSFFKIADCTWRVVSENELRVEAKWGTSPYFRLDLIMVHGPACLMSFEAGGRWSLDVLNWSVANYTIPPTNVTATLPCLNFDVTQASEFEWAPGRNNGVGLKITGLGSVIPVSDNRVRLSLDLPLPGLPPGIDLELLTGRA